MIGETDVTEARIANKGAYKTRLNTVISSEAAATGFAPNAVRRTLVAMTRAGEHVHDTRRDAVLAALDLLREEAWERLKRRDDIVYADPPLTEAAARAAVTGIERADPAALAGLQQAGLAYAAPSAATAREHEWGILKARSRADECMLIIGERTGVSWGPFLNCGTGIAHSHPYFETGKTRDRYGAVSLDTKQIAHHPPTPSGAIRWDDLATRNSMDAQREISKIFPSASDIKFSADKRVPEHTVYTPYAVVGLNGADYIANPEAHPNFRQAPRLVFTIVNAQRIEGSQNYRCTLRASAGTAQMWSSVVRTEGTGQFGLLRW